MQPHDLSSWPSSNTSCKLSRTIRDHAYYTIVVGGGARSKRAGSGPLLVASSRQHGQIELVQVAM